MVDGIPTCKIGHKMVISSFAEKDYQHGFFCDVCEEQYSTARWFCEICYKTRYGVPDQCGEVYHGEDICLKCVPEKEKMEAVNPDLFHQISLD